VLGTRATETVSYPVPRAWRSSFAGAAADFVEGVRPGRPPAQAVPAAKHVRLVARAIFDAGRTGRAGRPDAIT
jgi:hypothetical protein